jgi:hypothetical protein
MKLTQNSIAFGNLSRSIACALLTFMVCLIFIEYKPILGRPRSGKSSLELLTRDIRIAKREKLEKSGKSSKSIRSPYLRLREVPQKEIIAQETSTHILQCEAGGSPTPTIHWLKNGKRISQSESTKIDDDVKKGELSLSFTRSRLYLDCIHPKDEAVYTCVASSPFDRISADSHLKVIPNLQSSEFSNEADNSVSRCLAKKAFGYAARIHMWTHNILELIGSEVQLFCRSSGLPTPTTSWVGPEDNPIINSEKYKILESGDLLIRDLTWDDMGNYTVCDKIVLIKAFKDLSLLKLFYL